MGAAQPPHGAPGVDPPTQRVGSRSPSRKTSLLSGRSSSSTAPVLQSALPDASFATTFRRHVLMAGAAASGSGSGGPKRQPALEQFRLVPVSAAVVGPANRFVPLQHTLNTDSPMSGTIAGSGWITPPPPK